MSYSPLFILSRVSPALVFVCLQLVRVTEFSPTVELYGDAVTKWFLAISNSENGLIDYANHHHLRWGSWAIPHIFSNIFSDDLYIYFLSTVIPSTLAGVIFILIASFAIGPIAASLLTFIWMIDPQIYRATFQLLPTGQGLLPLAAVCGYVYFMVKQDTVRTFDIVVLSVLLFWMYGVKETNLFFVPAVIVFLWQNLGIRGSTMLCAMLFGLYIIESLFFYIVTDGQLVLGRVYELILGDHAHLNQMTSNRITNQLAKYYDGGWSFRFYAASKFHVAVYFLSALVSLVVISRTPLPGTKNKIGAEDKIALIYAYLFLSFFILVSIFIVKLDPLVLGQPLRSRYLAILLPLAYLILLFFVQEQLVRSNFVVKLVAILALWMFLAEPLQWSINNYKKNNRSIYAEDRYYANLGIEIEKADCLISKNKKHLIFKSALVPENHRGLKWADFESVSIRKVKEGYIKNLTDRCDSLLSIK